MPHGFTLIELSIVLVIIGLIVGGILTGQSLIGASQVRATIAQIEKYNTAANAFRGKYGFLPGDIKDPEATNFGFATRGTSPAQGDGNGLLESYAQSVVNGLHWSNEPVMFWVDLSKAGLVDGGFTTACPTCSGSTVTISTSPNLDAYLPQAKLGGGNYVYVWSYQGLNYYTIAANLTLGNPGWYISGAGLTVQQASAIDQKMDDGMPQSGNVTATYLTGNYPGPVWVEAPFNNYGAASTSAMTGSATTCYDNGNSAGVTRQYSLSQSGGSNVNCALSFRFQ